MMSPTPNKCDPAGSFTANENAQFPEKIDSENDSMQFLHREKPPVCQPADITFLSLAKPTDFPEQSFSPSSIQQQHQTWLIHDKRCEKILWTEDLSLLLLSVRSIHAPCSIPAITRFRFEPANHKHGSSSTGDDFPLFFQTSQQQAHNNDEGSNSNNKRLY